MFGKCKKTENVCECNFRTFIRFKLEFFGKHLRYGVSTGWDVRLVAGKQINEGRLVIGDVQTFVPGPLPLEICTPTDICHRDIRQPITTGYSR